MSIEKKTDPRVIRTRRLIEEAFLDLLKMKSFQSMTVQDITDRANINRSTFYAHFDDKYSLYDHILRETFNNTLQRNLPPATEFSLDNLKTLIMVVCEYLTRINSQYNPSDSQFKPMIVIQVQSQLYEFLLEWINNFQEDYPNQVSSPEITASIMSWAIYGVGLQWNQFNSHYSLEEISDQVISLLIRNPDNKNRLFYFETSDLSKPIPQHDLP